MEIQQDASLHVKEIVADLRYLNAQGFAPYTIEKIMNWVVKIRTSQPTIEGF